METDGGEECLEGSRVIENESDVLAMAETER